MILSVVYQLGRINGDSANCKEYAYSYGSNYIDNDLKPSGFRNPTEFEQQIQSWGNSWMVDCNDIKLPYIWRWNYNIMWFRSII